LHRAARKSGSKGRRYQKDSAQTGQLASGELVGELRAEKNQRNAADKRKPGQVIDVKAAEDFAG